MTRFRNTLLLVVAMSLAACDYIVLPEEDAVPTQSASQGWKAIVTNVESVGDDLHIDLTLRNDTADWSAMQALADSPPVLTTSGGQTTVCDTAFVSTGGHRLAPGFQMRGYIGGTKAEPVVQPIYVECKGAEAAGSTLAIDYSYVTGEYNYYDKEANTVNDTLEINLDEVVTDLAYPVAQPVEELIQKPGAEIVALNEVVLVLTDVQRTESGLQFTWQTNNPSDYPSYVHVGNPPVIGSDGILYGFYETPDIVSVPVTPAGDKTEWTTEVAVPAEVNGLYIMLSVESKKQRLFVNYAVDITDK
jgi:hypothetical protein